MPATSFPGFAPLFLLRLRKEAQSGKEVAVHLNGQTATSFLMADSNLYECQPPLFQGKTRGEVAAAITVERQPPLPLRATTFSDKAHHFPLRASLGFAPPFSAMHEH
jgi:hypothetical protein